MAANASTDPTRDRLLDEAERLFAERGFYDVSVREITAAAGSNTAAVNYHFGSKKNLYLAVFSERWTARAAQLRAPLEALKGRQDLTLELVLRTFVRSFLRKGLSDEERVRHAQLIAREMSRPSEAFQIVAKEALEPMADLMIGLVGSFLLPNMDPLTLRLNGLSIFALNMYFNFARMVVTHVTGREYDEQFLDRLEDHLVSFILHGLDLNGSKEDACEAKS